MTDRSPAKPTEEWVTGDEPMTGRGEQRPSSETAGADVTNGDGNRDAAADDPDAPGMGLADPTQSEDPPEPNEPG